MKNKITLFLLIFISTVIYNSCAFLDDFLEPVEKEKNQTTIENKYFSFKTVLPSEETITFEESKNNKKLFVIYTNETKDNLKHQRSLNNQTSNMTIYKGVTYMGNGIYRDEVHFDNNFELKPSIQRSAETPDYRSGTDVRYRSDNDNKFYALFNSNNFYTESKEFELKIDGKHCRIWFWDNNQNVVDKNILTNNEFQKLADNFDLIFEKETQIFGSNTINGYSNCITANENTKIEILVYDLFGDANPDQDSGTLGFFNPADFIYSSTSKSNQCEAIHVDSYFLQFDIKGSENGNGQIVYTDMTTSTIVHEFQHLLNYCQKKILNNVNVSEWYNEMLSMCAEDIFENILNLKSFDTAKSRFNKYFDTPWQGFYNWPKEDKTKEGHEKVLHAYANAYAFGAYLMRNYGGVELIHNICTNSFADEDSIKDALHKTGYVDENFNTVLQKFGSIYILNTGGITLNKKVNSKLYGVNYTLTPINLSDYYFIIQNPDYDFNKYYYVQGKTVPGSLNGQAVMALYGPGIIKAGYVLNQEIQNTGFVVYYIGTIDSSKTYSITNIKKQTINNDNLTMSIVVIE